jgi:hypothetical protein
VLPAFDYAPHGKPEAWRSGRDRSRDTRASRSALEPWMAQWRYSRSVCQTPHLFVTVCVKEVIMIDWSWPALADALAAGLARAAEAVELEQAVRGLDACAELELHPVLQAALRDAGYGVFPEQRFPRDRGRRKRSAGARCDLVVTDVATGAAELDDAALADALWIEVKVVAQFQPLGPNRSYAGALQSPVWADVAKLASDPAIAHGLVLLVLFTADAATADHDLEVWRTRAIERGLRLWPRVQRSLPIGDRHGNRLCTVALFPLDRG